MLFDDLEIFDFEMSYCAALRLLTPSWNMNSSTPQKVCFSAVDLSTCVVAIEFILAAVDTFNRAE